MALLVVAVLLVPIVALSMGGAAPALAGTLRDGPARQPHPEDLDPEETAPAPEGGTLRSGSPLARMSSSPAEKAALRKLLATDPSDLWGVADSVVQAIQPTWDAKRGVYHAGSAVRARANAEMLLVHSQAVLAGHHGDADQPQRIAPLVKFLTGAAWQEHAITAHNPNCPHGGAECWHAMGFIDPGARATMHRSRDAVVMRALAAAWQARRDANLSPALVSRLHYVVARTARSAFWLSPKRLENQVNWTADVMDAYTTVTGSDTLIKREYPAQLHWFLSHARQMAYPAGTDNLSVGLGFHYVPTKPDSYIRNGADTVEYANITFSALKYLDSARKNGAPALSSGDTATLRSWSNHLLRGNWTTAGYLNWDSGHGVGRLHLNQYWLLSLRGLAMGLAGTTKERLFPDQVQVARGLVRRAVQLYQRRAKTTGSPILGPSAYGFYGSDLIGEHFDGLTGSARMAELMAEFAHADLGAGPTSRLPSSYSHDAQFGRLAVTTGTYSAAIVGPWRGLHTGGAEPARIMDDQARVLTQIGGGGNGTLGLAISSNGTQLLDTEPGASGHGVTRIHVDNAHKNHSGDLGSGVQGTANAVGAGVKVHLSHRFTDTAITTTYTIDNTRGQPLDGVLRVPTYGSPNASSLHKHPPSVAQLASTDITTADDGGFSLTLHGLPRRTTTRVINVKGEQSNPQAGAELLISVPLRPGRTTITRTITPHAEPADR